MAKRLNRHQLLIDTLDRIEHGVYTGLDMYWCINTFDWLRQYKKIDKAEEKRLLNTILRIQGLEDEGGGMTMAHKGKWRNICGLKKSQDCFNCTNKQQITETKRKITAICDIGTGQRVLEFDRYMTPYCGCWCQKYNEKFN